PWITVEVDVHGANARHRLIRILICLGGKPNTLRTLHLHVYVLRPIAEKVITTETKCCGGDEFWIPITILVLRHLNPRTFIPVLDRCIVQICLHLVPGVLLELE